MVDIFADTEYLATLVRQNLCVRAQAQAERVFSWMGWLLKKKALSGRRICQHATILEGQSWALDCFCHCDVFSTINWLYSFLDFLINVFLFHTSESIICRKLPYKYIYYVWETISSNTYRWIQVYVQIATNTNTNGWSLYLLYIQINIHEDNFASSMLPILGSSCI